MKDAKQCVPEDIYEYCCEPVLNPKHMIGYYQDKNFFDKILPVNYTAKTYLRCINYQLFNEAYQLIALDEYNINYIDIDAFIVKPTIDSCGGIGVCLFKRKNNQFINVDTKLTISITELISSYKGNFIIQELLVEHDSLLKFNPSSVNTIRAVVYKSVVTGRAHLTSACLRIGAPGKHVDNGHSGGHFASIDKNGVIGKFSCDSVGKHYTVDNGIDFSEEHIVYNWNQIKDFAESISQYVPYHHVLALDIMIDKSGTPKIIEYNIGGFGSWLFQFVGSSCFGEYTDEIIEYCRNRHVTIPPQSI